MLFDVTKLDSQQKYRLLNSGVTPRPIAWISTQLLDNVDNLAPYSFFTVASCNPPVLLYTQVTPRSGGDKDTLQNLIDTGECVVNIANVELLEKMTSASLKPGDNEFAFVGVESCPSQTVTALSVKASPVRYECSLRQLIPISDLPRGGTVVLLDVRCIYVQDNLYHEGNIDQQLVDSVGKMGGNVFSLTSSINLVGK